MATPAACTLVAVNNKDGTVTATCSDSAVGVDNLAYYMVDGAASAEGPISRTGDGTILVPATGVLVSNMWYTFWIISSVGGYVSLPSNLVRCEIILAGSTDVASRAIEEGILRMVRDRRSQWYRRKTGAGYPGAPLNADYTPTGSDTYAQTHVQKVADQSDLWIHLGEVPVLITESSPFSLLRRAYGEEEVGAYTGKCAARFIIRKEDHLIDPNGREFRVITSDMPPSAARSYRRLSLGLLP